LIVIQQRHRFVQRSPLSFVTSVVEARDAAAYPSKIFWTKLGRFEQN